MVAERLDITKVPTKRHSHFHAIAGRLYQGDVRDSLYGVEDFFHSGRVTYAVVDAIEHTGPTNPMNWQEAWEAVDPDPSYYLGVHAEFRHIGINRFSPASELTHYESVELGQVLEAVALLSETIAFTAPDLRQVTDTVQTSLATVRDSLFALQNLPQIPAEHAERIGRSAEALSAALTQASDQTTQAERGQTEQRLVASRGQPWLVELNRLKSLASLTDDELADIFGVSRGNIQGWMHRGQGMRRQRHLHLQKVLAVVEDWSQRADGNPQTLHHLLFAPIGQSDERPIDYLSRGDYHIARGFLQIVTNTRERRRPPLRPEVRRSLDDRLAALEALSPSPRDPDFDD